MIYSTKAKPPAEMEFDLFLMGNNGLYLSTITTKTLSPLALNTERTFVYLLKFGVGIPAEINKQIKVRSAFTHNAGKA